MPRSSISMDWKQPAIRRLIALALDEDQARHDVTTSALIGRSWRVHAAIVAKQAGIVAGLPLVAAIFQTLDKKIKVAPVVSDGSQVRAGQTLVRISGSARHILSGERPALNALQHLSGIATYAHAQVQRLGRNSTKLFDTRKTIPGWRWLEKYAVRCGGAQNHRLSLGDAVLVKENHLLIARLAGGSWQKSLQALRRRRPTLSVQIEVQNWTDLHEAIAQSPDRLLLDNFSTATLRHMIKKIRRELPKAEIEISGGVRSDQLPGLAKLGVERISMGRLTHSAPAFDCSLDISRVYSR